MINPRADRVKKIVMIIVGVTVLALLAALVGGSYLLSKITTRIPFPTKAAPSDMDTESGMKKLTLLQQSPLGGKRGFVSFSDSELNSILQRHYLGRETTVSPLTNAAACRIVAARLVIGNSDTIWTCWIQKMWLGRQWNMAWQRRLVLARENDRWTCKVTLMALGRQKINPKYWPYVYRWLGDADRQLAEVFDWLSRLPSMDIAINDLTMRPELRIFNYLDSAALEKAKP